MRVYFAEPLRPPRACDVIRTSPFVRLQLIQSAERCHVKITELRKLYSLSIVHGCEPRTTYKQPIVKTSDIEGYEAAGDVTELILCPPLKELAPTIRSIPSVSYVSQPNRKAYTPHRHFQHSTRTQLSQCSGKVLEDSLLRDVDVTFFSSVTQKKSDPLQQRKVGACQHRLELFEAVDEKGALRAQPIPPGNREVIGQLS